MGFFEVTQMDMVGHDDVGVQFEAQTTLRVCNVTDYDVPCPLTIEQSQTPIATECEVPRIVRRLITPSAFGFVHDKMMALRVVS